MQALSPLSPSLNLMWHRQEPRPQLTGVLWMTSVDALSPFFRVPLPSTNDDCETYSTQPSAWLLRALTLTGFLTNWVAWLSRVEYSASLGMTRVSPAFVSVPVAAGLLQPYSLGFGQAPLMGMWPLWLLRQVLTLNFLPSRLDVGVCKIVCFYIKRY